MLVILLSGCSQAKHALDYAKANLDEIIKLHDALNEHLEEDHGMEGLVDIEEPPPEPKSFFAGALGLVTTVLTVGGNIPGPWGAGAAALSAALALALGRNEEDES